MALRDHRRSEIKALKHILQYVSIEKLDLYTKKDYLHSPPSNLVAELLCRSLTLSILIPLPLSG